MNADAQNEIDGIREEYRIFGPSNKPKLSFAALDSYNATLRPPLNPKAWTVGLITFGLLASCWAAAFVILELWEAWN